MEKLLHYIWKHRILPLSELRTTDGHSVEVIDPGLLNMHAGPDFFNAKVRIDGEPEVAIVEQLYAVFLVEDGCIFALLLAVGATHADIVVAIECYGVVLRW